MGMNSVSTLSNKHPDDGQQADGDGHGGERDPQYLGLPAEEARGRGGENQPLRGEHAGVAPSNVLHRGREARREIEASRCFYL